MKDKQKLIYHAITVVVMIVTIALYFSPAFFSGKVIKQDDLIRGKATSHEIRDHRDTYGEEPLWTNSQFSGMPTFQMNTENPGNVSRQIDRLVKLYLPAQTGLIFTLMLGFYLLLISFKVDPWTALIGAIAYGFSTYFIISFAEGHTGKLRVTGYIAPTLAGILLTFRGKRLLGAAATALGVSLCISSNHLQIVYYFIMVVFIVLISHLIIAIREKQLKKYLINATILAAAAILAVGPNVSVLWSTWVYGKETIRGGTSELTAKKETTSGGLDIEYATGWSYGKMEIFTLLIPNFYGGASNGALSTSSDTYDALIARGVPKKQAERYMDQLPLYWGEQTFTKGPVYIGAIICFLFILGLFIIRGPTLVWVVSLTVFAILLSWGRHFLEFYEFFFDYLPLFNKFRTPSMILTLVCFTGPLLGIIALSKVLKDPTNPQVLKGVLFAFYITGGLCLFWAILGGAFFDFKAAADANLAKQGWPVEALISDRQSLLQNSAWRSLIFIGLAFLALFAFIKGKLSKPIVLLSLGALIAIDLIWIDRSYFDNDRFETAAKFDKIFAPTEADKVILQDTDPHFRVINVAVNPFTDAMTSYHHKSIGGYSAAKLIRYQDLYENQMARNNMKVFNMLNTKYFLTKDQNTGQMAPQRNPGALGNAWFVEDITWVEDADEEITALNTFEPAREVIIDKRYQPNLDNGSFQPSYDSSASIKLTQYKANHMIYECDVNSGEQFAVFSEIYYEGGNNDWKCYIDGVETSHIRVNYALRGMRIPAGSNKVEFVFHPRSYYTGEKIAFAGSTILVLLFLGAIFMEWKNRNKSLDRIEKAEETEPLAE